MNQWYLYEDEEVKGPFDKDELSGRVDPESLICRAGKEEWNPAESIPELKDLFLDDSPTSPGTISPEGSSQEDQPQKEQSVNTETKSEKSIDPIAPTLDNLREICEQVSDQDLRIEHEQHRDQYDERELKVIRSEMERRGLLVKT